jgi:hypothetical protein
MNAQAEFLNHIMHLPDVKAVTIMIDNEGYGLNPEYIKIFNLREGFTDEEYTKFIEDLDVEYDDGYGTQHLFGKIWFVDGSWSDRYEYDGSKCWTYQELTEVWHYNMQFFIDIHKKHKEQMDDYYAERDRKAYEEDFMDYDPDL